jgi:hypothetical protein
VICCPTIGALWLDETVHEGGCGVVGACQFTCAVAGGLVAFALLARTE